MFHSFLSQLVRKFFQQSSGRKYFTFAWVFIRNLCLNSIRLILTCELKLNCRDLRRVKVMTSSSSDVSKLHGIVECSFLFPLVQELYKSTRRCKSYSRKYVVPYLWNTVLRWWLNLSLPISQGSASTCFRWSGHFMHAHQFLLKFVYLGQMEIKKISWHVFWDTVYMHWRILAVQVWEDRWISYVVLHWVMMVSVSQSSPCRLLLTKVNQRLYLTSNQVFIECCFSFFYTNAEAELLLTNWCMMPHII